MSISLTSISRWSGSVSGRARTTISRRVWSSTPPSLDAGRAAHEQHAHRRLHLDRQVDLLEVDVQDVAPHGVEVPVLQEHGARPGPVDREVDDGRAPLGQGSAQLAVGERERQRGAARLVDDAGHEAPPPEPARGSVAELRALLRVERDVCHQCRFLLGADAGVYRTLPAHSRTGNRLRSRGALKEANGHVRHRRRPPGRSARGEPGRDRRAPGGDPLRRGRRLRPGRPERAGARVAGGGRRSPAPRDDSRRHRGAARADVRPDAGRR